MNKRFTRTNNGQSEREEQNLSLTSTPITKAPIIKTIKDDFEDSQPALRWTGKSEIKSIENKVPAIQSIPLVRLLGKINQVIDLQFPQAIWVEAEIAKMRKHSSGHLYMELVERSGQGQELGKMNAKIWSKKANELLNKFNAVTGEKLNDGMKCHWLVNVEFSVQYGFSLTVQDLLPLWSQGEHDIKKEVIRKKLQDSGVWLKQKQWGNVDVITSIAVVAPFEAAGLGDFLSEASAWEKHGLINVEVFNATFEGTKASDSICDALSSIAQKQSACLNNTGALLYDLVIILRGGGSKTSLSWLDDEHILQSVLDFPGRVWCAIGHEMDSGLLDEVVHWSSHTPSKAAQKIWELLYNETRVFEKNWQELQESINLQHNNLSNNVLRVFEKIEVESKNRIQMLEKNVESMAREAIGLGPKKTMSRGYSVVKNAEGKIIKDANEVSKKGDVWEIHFGNGKRLVKPENK